MAVPPSFDAPLTPIYQQGQLYAPPGQPLQALFRATVGNGPFAQAPQAGMAPARKLRPTLSVTIPEITTPRSNDEPNAPTTEHAPHLTQKRALEDPSDFDSDVDEQTKRIRSHY
jgi:hypothetical protein